MSDAPFTDEQVRAFLTDLAVVSAKHGIGIEGATDDPAELVPFPPGATYSVFFSYKHGKYRELTPVNGAGGDLPWGRSIEGDR